MTASKGIKHLDRDTSSYRIFFTIVFFLFLAQATSIRFIEFDNQYWSEFLPGIVYPPPMLGTNWTLVFSISLALFWRTLGSVFRATPAALFLILFWSFLSIVWSIDWVQSAGNVLALINLITICGLSINILGSNRTLRIIFIFGLCVLVISTVLAAASSNYSVMRGVHDGLWRGIFNHKNTYGAFSGSLLILSVACRHRSLIGISLFLFSVFICLVSLIMAGSATALIATAASLLIYYSILLVGNHPLRVIISFLLLLAALVCALSFYDEIISGFVNVLARDVTLSGRTEVWHAAMQVVWERPFQGYGFGTSGGQAVIDEIRYLLNTSYALSVHSAYVDLSLGFGVLATLFVISWFTLQAFGLRTAGTGGWLAVCSGIATFHLVIGFVEVSGGLRPSFHFLIFMISVYALRSEARGSDAVLAS